MLYQALDYVKTTAQWTVGINNLSAIKDVMNDDYTYNTGHDEPTTKLKQVGTEALHAGLKYATIATLTDKSLTYLNIFPAPAEATFRHAVHTVITASQDLPAQALPYAVAAGGAASLALNGWGSVKDVAEGILLIAKPVVKNNDTGRHEIRPDNVGAGIKKIAMATVAIPIFTAYYTYGFTGAGIATMPYLIATKSDYTLLKMAFLGAGLIATLSSQS